jgi:hypothetical protein
MLFYKKHSYTTMGNLTKDLVGNDAKVDDGSFFRENNTIDSDDMMSIYPGNSAGPGKLDNRVDVFIHMLKNAAESTVKAEKFSAKAEKTSMSKRLLLAGEPSHLDKFKESWWWENMGDLLNFIPNDVVVETIDPMVFDYADKTTVPTHADHVVSLWDDVFLSEHKNSYDYVVLPDLNGEWASVQRQGLSVVRIHELCKLMVSAMGLVKPGGCGIFDKIFLQEEMKKSIANKIYPFDDKSMFRLQELWKPAKGEVPPLLVVVLWKL